MHSENRTRPRTTPLIKVRGAYQLPYTIRAEWTGYLVFSIIFVPIALLGAFAVYKNPSSSSLAPVYLPLIVLALFFVWIESFRITLSADGVSYKTLLSKGFNVQFAQIKKVEVDVGLYPSGSEKQAVRNRGFYRFNIFTNDAAAPFSINMKPFSKRDLAILTDVIAAQNPSVSLDERSRRLKDGDFKPILYEGLRKIWQILLAVLGIFLALGLLRALIR